MKNILILGGTAEARALATELCASPGIHVTLSLAGVTETPLLPPGNVRIGGFGGAEGLARYLMEHRIDLLIVAVHPFAEQISWNAIVASRLTGCPLWVMRRPLWQPGEGDDWIFADDFSTAADIAAEHGNRHFLAIGSKNLSTFSNRPDQFYLVRIVPTVHPKIPLEHYHLEMARGPFSVAHETSLMKRHRVQTLITKNGGGETSRAKLIAAKELNMPIIVIQPKVVEFSQGHFAFENIEPLLRAVEQGIG